MTRRSSRLIAVILIVILMIFPFRSVVCLAGAADPALFSFDELIALYKNETPPAPLARKLDKLLTTPFVGNRSPASVVTFPQVIAPNTGAALRVAYWNIERGVSFEDIRAALSGRRTLSERLKQLDRRLDHKEEERVLDEAQLLGQADVIILNEVDWGLKRTEYRHVAKELADALGMNYAFGVEFVEVDPLTLGTEKLEDYEIKDRNELLGHLAVDRERTIGLHGNAILSRYPLRNVRIVRFRNQGHDWFEGERKKVAPVETGKRKMAELAFLEKVMREVRRGGRMMMLAEIEDAKIPGGRATIVNVHLEAKTKPSNRRRQLEEVLAEIKMIDHPVILAGDLNTSGSDATPTSIRREVKRRLGSSNFWTQYGIKWVTGFGLLYDAALGIINFGRAYNDPTTRSIKFVMKNGESRFFSMLEEFRFADGGAFDFRGSKQRSADGRTGKLANSNERAMKGFKPTYEPERSFKVARLKLDWIFVKPPGLTKPDDEHGPHIFAPHYGRTLQALNYGLGERISDHNPMIIDLPFMKEGVPAPK